MASKKDGLIAAIECYVHSNAMKQAGVPADAVAKSYAGLDMLGDLLSEKTIRNSQGKVVRMQLRDHGVPHRRLCESKNPITFELYNELVDSPKCQVFRHGEDLLRLVRHYIIHPLDPDLDAQIKRKFREHLDVDRLTYSSLHDLSQFYLEYLILGLCEFQVRKCNYRGLRESPGFGLLD